MEKERSSEEKIKKMQELGIFEKWQANTDAHARELRLKRKCTILLEEYEYLSDAIESSFVFSRSPEGFDYWCEIVGQLREEI